MLPRVTGDTAAMLATALRRAGYDTAGVRGLLGPDAHAALGRGEPVPARRASTDGGRLGVLVRLFLLGDPEPESAVAAAVAPLPVDRAVAAGLLARDGDTVRAALDVRPHGDEHGEWWVVSDGAVPDPEQVLGVGQASISLVRATARRPVGTLLDLGTGCGVQALHAARHAGRITATDVSGRALAMAAATFALNDLDIELLAGRWFDPVADRRFDQVVSNPPFVVGPPRVDHVYRDSGLAGDAGSELVLRRLPDHLVDGGTGQLLASWLHRRGQPWQDRVTSWLPEAGVDAWVVQRDVADPALYVGTWLADSGTDPRSPQGRARAEAWLDWFDAQHVDGVGFGFVTVRTTGAADSTVVCEDLRHAYDDPLGPESADWLDRVAWLRGTGDAMLLDTVFVVAADVRLERSSAPGPEGWQGGTPVLHRTGGPGWRHETDERGAALLSGCTGALPVGELIGLLAAAHDEPVDAMVAAALPVLRRLVQHGMLLPVEGLLL